MDISKRFNMIKNSEIVVTICSANKKYWEKVLDKTLSIGNSITTNVELLPEVGA